MKKTLRIIFYVILGIVVLNLLGQWLNSDSDEKGVMPSESRRVPLSPEDKKADSIATVKRMAGLREAIRQEELKPDPERDLIIKKDSWETGGFGSVAIHSFSVYNKSKENDYKDITVKFTYYGASNSEIGNAEKIVYMKFPAGKTVRVKDLNAGFINQQTTAARVEVIN